MPIRQCLPVSLTSLDMVISFFLSRLDIALRSASSWLSDVALCLSTLSSLPIHPYLHLGCSMSFAMVPSGHDHKEPLSLKFWLSLDRCPGIGFKCPQVILCLYLLSGTSIVFSLLHVPFHTPNNSVERVPSLHTFSKLTFGNVVRWQISLV